MQGRSKRNPCPHNGSSCRCSLYHARHCSISDWSPCRFPELSLSGNLRIPANLPVHGLRTGCRCSHSCHVPWISGQCSYKNISSVSQTPTQDSAPRPRSRCTVCFLTGILNSFSSFLFICLTHNCQCINGFLKMRAVKGEHEVGVNSC